MYILYVLRSVCDKSKLEFWINDSWFSSSLLDKTTRHISMIFEHYDEVQTLSCSQVCT